MRVTLPSLTPAQQSSPAALAARAWGLRRRATCKATWSLRAGHTSESRRTCTDFTTSPSPASWMKTRSYRAVDEPLHQVQSSPPEGVEHTSRHPSLCRALSSPARRLKSPAKTHSWPWPSNSCDRLMWRSWLSRASRSCCREPDSACTFTMVQPPRRVVTRWRPLADARKGNDVVLSEPCLIAVTLK